MVRVKKLANHHPVAEVFLIAWAFEYMIEGASGFGTPVALAAPMLVSLGHPPVATITCCLITNTLATVYGAVGTPLWFGLDGLGLSQDDLKQVCTHAHLCFQRWAVSRQLAAVLFQQEGAVLLGRCVSV